MSDSHKQQHRRVGALCRKLKKKARATWHGKGRIVEINNPAGKRCSRTLLALLLDAASTDADLNSWQTAFSNEEQTAKTARLLFRRKDRSQAVDIWIRWLSDHAHRLRAAVKFQQGVQRLGGLDVLL